MGNGNARGGMMLALFILSCGTLEVNILNLSSNITEDNEIFNGVNCAAFSAGRRDDVTVKIRKCTAKDGYCIWDSSKRICLNDPARG